MYLDFHMNIIIMMYLHIYSIIMFILYNSAAMYRNFLYHYVM